MMPHNPTKSAVLAASAEFREEVRNLARRAMNKFGVTWREIDIDEIGIFAVNKLRLYERVCQKHGVLELSDTPRPPRNEGAQ